MFYYFRKVYNLFRITIKVLISKSHYTGSRMLGFSKRTELSFGKHSKIKISRSVSSDGSCRLVIGNDAKLEIGEKTYINNGCTISCVNSISIGSNCGLGPNVSIFDNNHDFDSNGVKSSNNSAPVVIGDRCWLATNVVILKGVTIGDNCVVGAGCVIKNDIPSGSIVTAHLDQHIHKIEDR